jgi:hypothetical protein
MESLVEIVAAVAALFFSIAFVFVIMNAIAKAAAKTVLGPIHAKLDRLLAMQEEMRDVGKV